jgi:hypothetical protein
MFLFFRAIDNKYCVSSTESRNDKIDKVTIPLKVGSLSSPIGSSIDNKYCVSNNRSNNKDKTSTQYLLRFALFLLSCVELIQ